MIDHGLTVKRVVHRPAECHIACHIVSRRIHGIPVDNLIARRNRRKRDSPGIHRLTDQELIAVHLLVAVHRRRVGDIHLSRFYCRKRRVFLHEQDNDFFHLHFIPVVVRIRLQNDLLPFVPLCQDISAGTDRVLPVGCFIVAVLRHDTEHRQCIQKRIVRLAHVENHRGVIRRLHGIEHT